MATKKTEKTEKPEKPTVTVIRTTVSVLQFPCGTKVRIAVEPNDDFCRCGCSDCDECNARRKNKMPLDLQLAITIDDSDYNFPLDSVDLLCEALQLAKTEAMNVK